MGNYKDVQDLNKYLADWHDEAKMLNALGDKEKKLDEYLWNANRILTDEIIEQCSENLYQYIKLAGISLDKPIVKKFLAFCEKEQFDFIIKW